MASSNCPDATQIESRAICEAGKAPEAALADPARRHRSLGMRIPYLFGALPVIGDNARSVARRAGPFILSALINNTFSVAFRADFFSHLCALQVGAGFLARPMERFMTRD
jgi:hypothetical protein